jgi:hypothetical protein
MATFGLCFLGASYPITDTALVRVDATHWVRRSSCSHMAAGLGAQHSVLRRCGRVFDAAQVLDVCTTVAPNYLDLKELCIFLAQPNGLDPALALGEGQCQRLHVAYMCYSPSSLPPA